MTNNQHGQDLNVELENKKREVEGLVIRSKEAEVDTIRKNMIIEGISEKVIKRNTNLINSDYKLLHNPLHVHLHLIRFQSAFFQFLKADKKLFLHFPVPLTALTLNHTQPLIHVWQPFSTD